MADEFPDDDNGDALRNMAMSGDDLSKERDIDFSVLFPEEALAREFCRVISNQGWRSDCHNSDDEPDIWDVTVTLKMTPTHEAISLVENQLARFAAPLSGEVEGWGCFAVATQKE